MPPKDLDTWFKERPQWLQDAARRVAANRNLTNADIAELVILCKREAGIVVDERPELAAIPVTVAVFETPASAPALRLTSISEIKGINALAPRIPLAFGDQPITVIYGANGSGKSGYIRVLKNICGARGATPLRGDTFKEQPEEQTCKVSYLLGNSPGEATWIPSLGVDQVLRSIAVYDDGCARIYINSENEVAYEPPLLRYFRMLVEVCEQVDSALIAQVNSLPSAKPAIPQALSSTTSGQWFAQLHHLTPEAEIVSRCAWTAALATELSALNARCVETNPAEKARNLSKTISHVDQLTEQMALITSELSNETFEALLGLRRGAAEKRRAASDDAQTIFKNAPLTGVASESWKLLWEQSRLYSESEAYKNLTFPVVTEGSRCLLCQQSLGPEARDRLKDFERFVKGGLESAATAAEAALQTALKTRSDIPSDGALEKSLDLAGITEELLRSRICEAFKNFTARNSEFGTVEAVTALSPLPFLDEILKDLLSVRSVLEKDSIAFESDAKAGLTPETRNRLAHLNALKWVSDQDAAIRTEVGRLKAVQLLSEARKLTNTKALSDKKSALAESLVTEAFVARFNNELGWLGASRLKVTIQKTRTTKGQVWHQVLLKDNKQGIPIGEVLSDGEFRVVSLAAFLADVTGKDECAPFIFDDPISSLDQDYEEATAARLVALSSTRQVIVFTHRLSLLAMLNDAADKQSVGVYVCSVQREMWGTGEPGQAPLPAQKPEKALKTLRDHRLAAARKIAQTEGSTAYAVQAKALCSDIRITVERLIEWDLLSDVIQRFRRPINTMGKLEKLAHINGDDCSFLEEMMTKYSRYEHSQPSEAPVSLPEPDELKKDLDKLVEWQAAFTSRKAA